MFMASVSRFEDLEIWQLARKQAQRICTIVKTSHFGKDFELIKQMNTSSESVMDKNAEGFARSGNKEFINLLMMAKGSNSELRSQLYRASDREYISNDELNNLFELYQSISAKIGKLISYLKQSDRKGFRYE